ncbi:MAG: hypothetical protein ACLQOO_27400 [Terriglobia bacterium]
MASESPDIPNSMRKVGRRFERWRSAHTGRRVPIPKRLWAAAAELARQAGSFPHGEGFAFGVWQVEAVGGSGGSGGAE